MIPLQRVEKNVAKESGRKCYIDWFHLLLIFLGVDPAPKLLLCQWG